MSTQKFSSINDLIHSEDKELDDTSAQAQLIKKQKEIKDKNIERNTEKIANEIGLGYVDLFGYPISPEAISLIDEKEAGRLGLVCFYYDGEHIRLGAVDPTNQEIETIITGLNKKYHTDTSLYLISARSFEHALKVYAVIPKIKKVKGVEITEEDLEKFSKDIEDYKSLNDKINDVTTTDVITLILATAMKTGASDIHIEAEEHGIVVRLRIDGVLQEAAIIEKDKWKKIISRMKVLAKVKINVTDIPQDGRYTIFLHNDKIDVRSSFLPTAYGESVVMRLLKSSAAGLPFDKLGLIPVSSQKLEAEISKPNGLILTTGPTGSGKTTTLYAILNRLNEPGTKIITMEDPVEYQLEGINQSQVNAKKGYTFAKGLRSILRQDPDIVMVGEIRDLETAEIAVQASLTGHLVLSTLHTNDSAGVIPRMIDMGVKPFFLVPSVNAIIAQRLIRKICPECMEEHILTEEEQEQVDKILAVMSPKAGISVPAKLPKIYKAGQGCAHCAGIGYKGRIGIYEIFTMSDDIKQLTIDNAPAFKILQQAIENGMITMLQDGVLKCLNGMTSLEEVYRVIGKFDYINELYDIVISNTIGRGIKVSVEEFAKAGELAKNLKDVDEFFSGVETKDMLNFIVALAVKVEAGDLHVDPLTDGVKIRFRMDGIMQDIVKLPKAHYLPILSKVKILSGFATNVKMPTMDGRFSIFIEERKIDCRVSIISGGHGETIVIRVLSNEAASLDMEDMGMRNYVYDALTKAMKKTKGVIITTGPTGSGKTTTLYAILNKLNTPEVKIITVEDPIEYQLEGVMQTQINKNEGYTFAAAMRSLLRQNPNIMMIGEIRDQETAEIAIEASMTGHLVLSTIHANSAAGAIARFVGLGITRQALSASIETAIGQRLVRRICPHCKAEDHIEPDVLEEVKGYLGKIHPNSGVEVPKDLKFYKGTGCDKCSGLGYKGRLGIYEVITMTPEMQKLIQQDSVTNSEIEAKAMEEGTILMIQDGLLKALEGLTTAEEILRVAR